MEKFSKIACKKLLAKQENRCYNTTILFALHINLQYKLNRQWSFPISRADQNGSR